MNVSRKQLFNGRSSLEVAWTMHPRVSKARVSREQLPVVDGCCLNGAQVVLVV